MSESECEKNLQRIYLFEKDIFHDNFHFLVRKPSESLCDTEKKKKRVFFFHMKFFLHFYFLNFFAQLVFVMLFFFSPEKSFLLSFT